MIKAGIIGGAGYTAGELIRILLNHPDVSIDFVQSSSQAGKPITYIHGDLIGETTLSFTDKIDPDTDILFICSGHGKSKEVLTTFNIADRTRIIDLSNDFRLSANAHFQGRNFVYGLPEYNKPKIQEAQSVANPGCFATAIQLGLLPLFANQQVYEDIHVNAITGSTGAGQSLAGTTHFTWRNNNISIYKPFTHQHLGEICETFQALQNNKFKINFIPVRGNFTRGIFASIYTSTTRTLPEIQDMYGEYFKNAPFVNISEEEISLKQVINTNKCLIHLQKHDDKILITSIIDNLVKGASGQAVQNMNLCFGLDEMAGLKLKPSTF